MTIHPGFELFDKFSMELKNQNRFFVNHDYLEIFDVIIEQNVCEVTEGTRVYRGRINKKDQNEQTPIPFEHLGMPKVEIVTANGRANPYGINYFYLSSNPNTVIAELRPNIRDFITIGEFEIKEPKRIVKLGSMASIGGSIFDKWSSDLVCMFMLKLILSFTTPVNKSSCDLAYLPSQYFAEYCKKVGYDGVMFLSSVMNQTSEENYNYVFFDDSSIQCINSKLRRITSISYSNYIESNS